MQHDFFTKEVTVHFSHVAAIVSTFLIWYDPDTVIWYVTIVT